MHEPSDGHALEPADLTTISTSRCYMANADKPGREKERANQNGAMPWSRGVLTQLSSTSRSIGRPTRQGIMERSAQALMLKRCRGRATPDPMITRPLPALGTGVTGPVRSCGLPGPLATATLRAESCELPLRAPVWDSSQSGASQTTTMGWRSDQGCRTGRCCAPTPSPHAVSQTLYGEMRGPMDNTGDEKSKYHPQAVSNCIFKNAPARMCVAPPNLDDALLQPPAVSGSRANAR